MLALRSALPDLPCVAALSANHLAILQLPAGLHRLYIARDADPDGILAVERLAGRAAAVGIEVRSLVPGRGDFNDDLSALGRVVLRARPLDQCDDTDALAPAHERRQAIGPRTWR